MTTDEKLQAAVTALLESVQGELGSRIIRVQMGGQQEQKDGRMRTRVIGITLRGLEAQQFVTSPNYEILGTAYLNREDFFVDDPYGVQVESVAMWIEEEGRKVP